ncbi:MAG TPA: GT-D fold domain-containing glycosyltransferase [Arthrobacter sp.]|nr:GT-D fold domain-containing glycosyltransferase [Arthrobacter sp.]
MSKVDVLRRIVAGTLQHRKKTVDAANRQIKLLEEQNKLLKSLVQTQKSLVQSEKKRDEVVAKLHWEAQRTRTIAENIRGAVMAPIRHDIAEVMQAKQLDHLETLAVIRDERKSFARFGDGEFRLMYRREHQLKFQKNSPELMAELKRVLVSPHPDTLLGMPQVFLGLHWSIVFAETWHFVGPLVATQERFGNSHVTRPAMFTEYGQEAVEAWRSVWAGRDAAVITGEGSRFDLIDPLFGSLRSSTEFFSKPTDAFDDLPRLVEQVVASGLDLALLSLGPAATIAADMLAARGVQALDIGHLSASYLNVLEGAALPEEMPTARRAAAHGSTK